MAAGMTPLRAGQRQLIRDAILDAARDLTVAHGWGEVRMADVAEVAGVSRRTVYNEFANRDGLADAMVRRELSGFMDGIGRVLDEAGGDLRMGVEHAVRFSLAEAAANPLVKAAVSGPQAESASLLPYLTTDAHLVLEGAANLIAEHARAQFPEIPFVRVSFGAETLARVVLSHIVLPSTPPDEVAANLADLVVRYVESLAAD